MHRHALVFSCLIFLFIPGFARAQGADSTRWSLGAALFNGNPEAFIGRRVRPTLDALFLVRLGGRTGSQTSRGDWGLYGTPTISRDSDSMFDIAVGPGLRRFTRSGPGLRPYGSVLATVNYTWQEMTTNSLTGLQYATRTYGLGVDWSLGAEYLTPWSMSLAVDASMANVEWHHARITSGQATVSGPAPSADTWGLTFRSSLAPRLLVRAYF